MVCKQPNTTTTSVTIPESSTEETIILVPETTYDSSGNAIITYKEVVKSELIFTNNTYTYTETTPTYGYCIIPNTIEISLNTLEIGTKFKVRADGGIVASEAKITEELVSTGKATLGSYTFEKNKLESPVFSVDNNSLSLQPYRDLKVGHKFKLVEDEILDPTTNKSYSPKQFNAIIEVGDEPLIIKAGKTDAESFNGLNKRASITLKTDESVGGQATQTINISTTVLQYSKKVKTITQSNDRFFLQDGNGNLIPAPAQTTLRVYEYTLPVEITATIGESTLTGETDEATEQVIAKKQALANYNFGIYYQFDNS
jgi:hypothetical protein